MPNLEAIVEPKIIAPGFEYVIVKTLGKNDVYIVRTNYKDQIDVSKLEKYVSGYRVKKGLKEGVESINELNKLIKQYIDGGEISDLDNYLTSNGYRQSKILEGREASNIIDQAIAYTDRDSIIGVSNQFQKNTEKMARQAKISTETAKYLAIIHEFMHTAQDISNKDLLTNEKYYRTNAEYEVEMLLTGFLYLKASQAKNKKERNEFVNAAKFTYHRAKVLEEYARRRQIPLEKQHKLYDIASTNKEIYEAAERGIAYVPPTDSLQDIVNAQLGRYAKPTNININ